MVVPVVVAPPVVEALVAIQVAALEVEHVRVGLVLVALAKHLVNEDRVLVAGDLVLA